MQRDDVQLGSHLAQRARGRGIVSRHKPGIAPDKPPGQELAHGLATMQELLYDCQ